jgi:REP element-mobilizing transposase RayT
MPEHVHLLLSEPAKSNPSKVLQVLKQKVSRALGRRPRRRPPGQLSLGFPDDDVVAAAFWQRRFYDFNVWSAKKVREKLEYMHANPVKRKLVMHPKDWPWSSGRIMKEEKRDCYGSILLEEGEVGNAPTARKVKNRTLKTEGCGTQLNLTVKS